MFSTSVLHQVSHFEDEDQILSHLAAKSASAYVLHLLHQSVRAPATHSVIHICGATLFSQMHYMQTSDRLTTIGRKVRLVFVWHT